MPAKAGRGGQASRGRRPSLRSAWGLRCEPGADRSGGRSFARALDNSGRWRFLRVALLLTAYASRRRLRSLQSLRPTARAARLAKLALRRA